MVVDIGHRARIQIYCNRSLLSLLYKYPYRQKTVENAQPNSTITMSTFQFDPIEEALAAFKAGEFVVVMDDEGRENEGDLVIAASECTTKKMAWFIKHTR